MRQLSPLGAAFWKMEQEAGVGRSWVCSEGCWADLPLPAARAPCA